MDSGSISHPGIELAFDGWAVAVQDSRNDALSGSRRGRIEFGQILESTPSRSRPCYPCRGANAGSVPFSTTNTQSPNPYRLGFFLPVPPVKTAMTSRASLRRRCVFRPDSRKFLSLLSVGTRALATPLRLFSMTYGQQVR